jgi:hypothetical protein
MSDTQGTPASTTAESPAPVESQTTESTEVVQEATPAEASKEATKEVTKEIQNLKKKFQLKVDGKEEDLELDLSNEEEVKKHLQLSRAAQKRMAESAQLKKDVEAFISALKTDPFSVLSNEAIGVDVVQLVNKYVEDQLKEADKTPEQKAQEKMQQELESLRKEKEDLEKRRQEEELMRYQDAAAVQLDKEITELLNSTASLPKSPYVVKRIADTMLLAMNSGYPNVTVKDVIPVVESQIREEIQGMFGAMPEEVMESVLGSSNLERWRNKKIAGIKKTNAIPKSGDVKVSGNATKQTTQPEKKISMRDFLKGNY